MNSTTTILAEAVEFNWQILCEKPIGLYPSDAKLFEQMHQTGIHAYLLRSIDDYSTLRQQNKLEGDDGNRLIEIHDQEAPTQH